MRSLPEIILSECAPNYARLAAQGWDSWQDAFNLVPEPEFIDLLEKAQKRAKDESLGNGFTMIELAGERFVVSPNGGRGGFRWRLDNDDFIVLVGSPKRDWTISIRYTSAALWEHGIGALRDRVFQS